MKSCIEEIFSSSLNRSQINILYNFPLNAKNAALIGENCVFSGPDESKKTTFKTGLIKFFGSLEIKSIQTESHGVIRSSPIISPVIVNHS